MTVFTILLIGAVCLGLIVGSFLNALSFRFNTGVRFFSKRGMGGRSRCMQCGHALASSDLVPLLSYLWLGGKCRYCHSRVSWQYPLVELLGGMLAAGVFIRVGETPAFIFWFVVWMTLLFTALYDIKHKIIPWSCSFLLVALAVCSLFFNVDAWQLIAPNLWALLAGPLLALPLFLLSLISWGRWMGWADSVLELSLGALLGLTAGATALMLAFWSGALVGIALMLLSRFSSYISSRGGSFRYTINSEIPFAPFLIVGAALAYFFHVDFFSSLALFY